MLFLVIIMVVLSITCFVMAYRATHPGDEFAAEVDPRHIKQYRIAGVLFALSALALGITML